MLLLTFTKRETKNNKEETLEAINSVNEQLHVDKESQALALENLKMQSRDKKRKENPSTSSMEDFKKKPKLDRFLNKQNKILKIFEVEVL